MFFSLFCSLMLPRTSFSIKLISMVSHLAASVGRWASYPSLVHKQTRQNNRNWQCNAITDKNMTEYSNGSSQWSLLLLGTSTNVRTAAPTEHRRTTSVPRLKDRERERSAIVVATLKTYLNIMTTTKALSECTDNVRCSVQSPKSAAPGLGNGRGSSYSLHHSPTIDVADCLHFYNSIDYKALLP